MKNLIGKKAKIISDNDNYDNYRDKTLIITYADNKGTGYDSACYPEMLCDLNVRMAANSLSHYMNTNLK